MSAKSKKNNQEPKISRTLWNDIHSGDLKNTLVQDIKEIYHFYITKERKGQLHEMGRVKKAIFVTFWILKGLFFKLTPLRRLMLVISIYLAFLENSVALGDTAISIDLQLMGYTILLLILLFELKDKLLARDELAAGRAVQKGLSPDTSPKIPGWDIFLYTCPANDVGGDLVDCMNLDKKRWGIAIGDVAGKGLGAAMLMARMIATIRAIAPLFPSLDELGNKVNQIFCRDGISSRFISLLYLHLDANAGNLSYINCGHMPPLIIKNNGIQELDKGDIALGLTPKAKFTVKDLRLEHGHWFFAYTDGITEAVNDKNDFFGLSSLIALINANNTATAKDLGDIIIKKIKQFAGTAPMYDDLSFILCRRT